MRAAIAIVGVRRQLGAFLPTMGTTPAATSNGVVMTYGNPGVTTQPVPDPAALAPYGNATRETQPTYQATGKFRPSIYFQRIGRALAPPVHFLPNDSPIPEPVGRFEGQPATTANPPKLGTRRAMQWPAALVSFLKLDGTPAQ